VRTLIAAVGYRDLRDHSAAFDVLDALDVHSLGDRVVIEDLSYNPIAVVQWFESLKEDERFDHVVLIGAVERQGRAPGTVTVRRWDGELPAPDLIQQAITEAVTGVIAFDNTVTIAGYFRALPDRVTLVEIQPRDHAFGQALSPAVAAAVQQAAAAIRMLVVPTASPLKGTAAAG
jgi:hydrogenase maturation protease